MTPSSDVLLRLIDRVYAAAQDDRAWEPFLLELADSLNGHSAALLFHDLNQTGGMSAAVRLDPLSIESYDQHFHTLDPCARSLRALPPSSRSGVFTGEMLIGKPDYRTEFLNDFAMRFAIPRMITAIMPTSDKGATSGVTALTIFRHRRDRPFDGRDRPLLGALVPHIVRALEVRQRLYDARQVESTLERVLELLPTSAMVLDQNARLLQVNRRAEALLARDGGLSVLNGVLTAATSVETSRLRAACARATGQRARDGLSGATVTVRSGVTRAPLRLIISPFTPEHALGSNGSHACALVLVDEPDRGPEPSVPLLQRLYGLTLTEAEIAARIGMGDALDEIASARSCTRQTIRWYSKQILSKMGCRSRSALVRRLTLSVASLADQG